MKTIGPLFRDLHRFLCKFYTKKSHFFHLAVNFRHRLLLCGITFNVLSMQNFIFFSQLKTATKSDVNFSIYANFTEPKYLPISVLRWFVYVCDVTFATNKDGGALHDHASKRKSYDLKGHGGQEDRISSGWDRLHWFGEGCSLPRNMLSSPTD